VADAGVEELVVGAGEREERDVLLDVERRLSAR
jgi:hypothetical protein